VARWRAAGRKGNGRMGDDSESETEGRRHVASGDEGHVVGGDEGRVVDERATAA
jgi:hypothetical protein